MKNIHVLPTPMNQNTYITNDEEIKKRDWIFDTVSNSIENANFNHYDLSRDYKKIILTTDQDLIEDGVQSIDDEFLEWFVKNPSCESVEVEEKEVFVGFIDANRKKPIYDDEYKIIIPKEESKQSTKERIMSETSKETKQKAIDYGNSLVNRQETLEEVGSYQQDLFSYLHELGIIALQSEMQEIEKIVLKMQEQNSDKKYSEEEVIELLDKRLMSVGIKPTEQSKKATKHWFRPYKKTIQKSTSYEYENQN